MVVSHTHSTWLHTRPGYTLTQPGYTLTQPGYTLVPPCALHSLPGAAHCYLQRDPAARPKLPLPCWPGTMDDALFVYGLLSF